MKNRCPFCCEVTYPDAYNTKDEDETHRICNGCGKDFDIVDFDSIELEDDEDLQLWYSCLIIAWTNHNVEYDQEICSYSLPEIEREIIRRDNIRQELE